MSIKESNPTSNQRGLTLGKMAYPETNRAQRAKLQSTKTKDSLLTRYPLIHQMFDRGQFERAAHIINDAQICPQLTSRQIAKLLRQYYLKQRRKGLGSHSLFNRLNKLRDDYHRLLKENSDPNSEADQHDPADDGPVADWPKW